MSPSPEQRTYRDTEILRHECEKRGDAIRRRLNDFVSVPPEEYFYELVYCLLTPQSSAVNAAKAVDALKSADLFSREVSAAQVLGSRAHYIRFHNTKARNLADAKLAYPAIVTQIHSGAPAVELRAWLVKNVRGLGWKEASHFLRNIGFRDLAILDRHILKNLKRHGVIRSIPATLTPQRYLSIEQRFYAFAAAIGITMDELDLLFWSRETGSILK
jgi:N-glycosylase/DNA lyase